MSAELFPDTTRPVTIEEGLAEACAVIERAVLEEGPIETIFLMLSGGNDSMVLLDALHDQADEIVHINTGIGIPETNEFVRWVVDAMGYPLTELHPPRSYESIVMDPKLFGGFPGPGLHHFAYTRLKERPLRKLLADRRTKRGQRFMLLTGIRNAESARRMGYGSHVNRKGGQVWVNPLLRWSNELMAEYRVTRNLPVNPVSAHLHMSGECLCGAFAHPGEMDEIAFFYPEFAARIAALEAQVEAAGLPNCKWGERPTKRGAVPAGPMCAQCTLWDEAA